MAEMTVRVEGTVTTTSSPAAPASVSITQGGQTANIAVPGPNLGAGLVTTSGSLISTTTLTNAGAVANGTTVDFGSGKQQITLAITAGAGVTAGGVSLEVSQNNVNWFRATEVALTQPGVAQSTQVGAWRYARGVVSTTMVGGTVSATLMAS